MAKKILIVVLLLASSLVSFTQTGTIDRVESGMSLKMEQRASVLKEVLSSDGKIAAVYIYPFTRQAYKDNPKKLATRLSILGFTDVYIEVPYEALNIGGLITTDDGNSIDSNPDITNWFKVFNKELRAKNIRSHAQLFGSWELFSFYWQKVLNLECNLFNHYQTNVANEEQFYGVAADIEPHATASDAFDQIEKEGYFDIEKGGYGRWNDTKGWANVVNATDSNSIMIQHTYNMLNQIKGKINSPLDQATSWVMQLRVDGTVEDGKFLTKGNSTDYLGIDKCNTISVMSYWETKEGTWQRFKPTLDNLKKSGSNYDNTAICSIDVYASEGEKGISLYPKGWDYVIETIKYIKGKANEYSSFAGIAIFDYSGLEGLWEGGDCLYSEGRLSVIGDNTTLFISGDFIAGTKDESDLVEGTCHFTIDENSKAILTGNFRHNAITGKVFNTTNTNSGTFEFRGLSHQNITTDGTDYITVPSKKDSYIDFPALVKIKNNKHITLDPSLAAKMPTLDLDEGWLILDSREVMDKDYPLPPSTDETMHRSVFAHLLANKINYNNSEASSPADRGFVQVNMQLDNRTLTTPSGYTQPYRSIVGLGIPFQAMKADYFMFNFLMAPNHNSFFGDSRSAIIDPRTTLIPGRGYGLGIDLRGTEQDKYSDIGRWVPVENFVYRVNGDPNDKLNGKYLFNRNNFSHNSHSPNQLFGSDATAIVKDAYTRERLNVEDVAVTLDKPNQYSYLANPFMTPLDLSDIINGSLTTWGSPSIAKSVWIMTGNTSMAVADYDANKMKVVYNFDVAQATGGTFIGTNDAHDDGMNPEVIIAPLQMFLVKSTTTATAQEILKIPAKSRVMGRTHFIKSTSQRYDDFIFEVTDTKTGISDRVSIVLRPATEIEINKDWANVKKRKTKDANNDNQLASSGGQLLQQNVFSQIYTMGNDNAAYAVQFFPIETTASLPLYVTSAVETQEISIRGIRLSSMRDVSVIYLQDKLEKKVIKMTPETIYTTISNPNDLPDRFILHFKETDINVEEASDIWAYYKNGVLTVSGFNKDDFGSTISLYNVMGARYLQKVVDNETMNIRSDLITGVYILQVEGKRKASIKVLAN